MPSGFYPGQNVQVVRGSLKGFIGAVERLGVDGQLVLVRVNFFGREEVAKVEPADLEEVTGQQ